MTDRIKLYAKYMGCKMAWIRVGKVDEIFITPFTLHINSDHINADETKLILKDFEKVSDVDWLEASSEVFPHNDKTECIRTNAIRNYASQFSTFHPSIQVFLIDFLRSKGYAYALDKKYYITPEEYEELKAVEREKHV